MARSLRSKRRRKNKQAMRTKLKPKYDAHLAAIVKTMQEQTDDLMETAGPIDISSHVQILDPDQMNTEEDKQMDTKNTGAEKIKIPKVDVNKIVKFMSQRKLRTFKAKEKTKKKVGKCLPGQKKRKQFKW